MRRGLLDRLHAGIGRGITLIEAPEGVGKTVLIADFVSEIDCKVAYVSVDESCKNPEVLAERLLMVLGKGNSNNPSAVLLSDLRSQLKIALARYELTPSQLLLIVDNLEFLSQATDSAAMIDEIWRSMPAGGELLLCGKTLPCPETEREAKKRGAVTLAKADFVPTSSGKPKLATAENQTELRPWSVTTEPGSSAERRFHPRHKRVSTVEKPAVPERLATAVEVLALAPEVSYPSIAEITGDRDFARTLWFYLEESGSDLLEPSFGDGQLRFRPAIRSNSYQRMDCHRDSHRASLLKSCAARFLKAGWLHHVAVVAVASQLSEITESIVTSEGIHSLRRGEHSFIEQLMADSERDGAAPWSPLSMAVKARISANAGEFDDALRFSSAVLEATDSAADAKSHALIAAGSAFGKMGKMEALSATIDELSDLHTDVDTDTAKDIALHLSDYEIMVTGDFAAARKLLEPLATNNAVERDPAVALGARSRLANIDFSDGKIRSAMNAFEILAKGWEKLGRNSRLPTVLNNLGVACASVGESQNAERHLERALELAKSCELPDHEAYALASLAELELAAGRPAEARAHFNEALEICSGGLLEERLRALVLAGLASCAVALDHVDEAVKLATRSRFIAADSAGPTEQATCMVELARALAARHETDSAESLFEEATRTFEALGASAQLLSAKLRLANFYYAEGKKRRARSVLESAARITDMASHRGLVETALRESREFGEWVFGQSSFKKHLEGLDPETVLNPVQTLAVRSPAKLPTVSYASRSAVALRVGDEIVDDEVWARSRARRLFEMFLGEEDGVSEEEAKRALNPTDPVHRGNSALHSALHELQFVLYRNAVVKDGDRFRLNPEGKFRQVERLAS